MYKKNNQVSITGKVVTEPTLEDNTYYMNLSARRLSGTEDVIPLAVGPEVFKEIGGISLGDVLEIDGILQSALREEGKKYRLFLSVLASKIKRCSEESTFANNNRISLTGYLCKPPVSRTTPKEKKITDLFIAVQRSKEKTDYIPCICWWDQALRAAEFQVGDVLFIQGRIQSREYTKKLSEDELEKRVVCEVSSSVVERDREEGPEQEDEVGCF